MSFWKKTHDSARLIQPPRVTVSGAKTGIDRSRGVV
jgi:hypothetical protein